MLGLGRSVITGLIEAGFVAPQRGARNEYRFTFQDVVLLRTAYQLRAARVPARRVINSLKQLKARLPLEVPLSGLRITAVGSDVAVREGHASWNAENGQFLIDFEVAAAGQGTVAFLERTEPAAGVAPQADDAETWFARADGVEASDPAAAEAAYRRALVLAPAHVNATLNLGVLLSEQGRHADALAVYDAALAAAPDAPLLHFNRAVALEDDGRPFDALAAYNACLALAPDFADAHFNAARLHEELGQMQGALRHYSAYRRLQP
ncbi:tetratricopeptide repeat protein [Aquincola sp. S2]|uniref:Tetratricopeptide repeat protein n=2 Tax=Pseudaquabacterium terrae TaxID=2732868 RepID=A0ABX2E9Q5_9BURK|nr:tetratricopeptide repeat protein [Aquabacterium terrae]NRF65505.1 tetratricopeptide repeat protein [Aquabacterium terrae]